VLTIFQKHLGNEEESASLHEEVLSILACMITENDTDTLKVIDMATPHAQNKSADVRKSALNLLETILSTEGQHDQNIKVLDSLHILNSAKTSTPKYSSTHKHCMKNISQQPHSASSLPRHRTVLLTHTKLLFKAIIRPHSTSSA